MTPSCMWYIIYIYIIHICVCVYIYIYIHTIYVKTIYPKLIQLTNLRKSQDQLTQIKCIFIHSGQFSLLSHIWLYVTLWTATHQASLSIANSRSLLKLMSIQLVMLSNHLILCCSLLLLPSIFPNIRVFSNKSVLCTRWPKC